MKLHARSLIKLAILVLAIFASQPSAQSDTFGSGTNAFTIDFVRVGDAGNNADTTGYGAVPYEYRIGMYEVPLNNITKAVAGGLTNVTAEAWTSTQPAWSISWYDAAAFVNFLNSSTGKQVAYDLVWTGSQWSMNLWPETNAWSLGGTNRYRHKDSYYFLPSDNEWYKAAYYSSVDSKYFDYPTGSDSPPIPVARGTSSDTAVYSSVASEPAPINEAGGLSPSGTMGQGGNVWEWMESAFDGSNNSPSEARAFRGGYWGFTEEFLNSSFRNYGSVPSAGSDSLGFRVASVPEPSTLALVLVTGIGTLLYYARLRR